MGFIDYGDNTTKEDRSVIMEQKDQRLCDTRHGAVDKIIELNTQKLEKLIDKSIIDNDKRCDLVVQKIETRLHGMDVALDLKTGELEKKLRELNDLRSDVTKDRILLVPKSVYDIKTEFYDRWIATVNDRLTTIETRLLTGGVAVVVFFSIVELALHFFVVGK